MFENKPRMTYNQYIDFIAMIKVEGHTVIVRSKPTEFLGKIE